MDIMGPFRNSTDDDRTADGRFAVVHTDDDEDIVFRGASDDEVEAKLQDFLTWAS